MEYRDNLTVIFEAPDGGGKSTLIEELRKRHPNLELVDRSFVSDAVYSIKFRRETYEGIPVRIYVDYWAYWHKNNRDTRIVLCNPRTEVLAERCMVKNEPFCRNRTFEQVVEHLEIDRQEFINIAYTYASRMNMPIIEVDTEKSIEECIKEIEEFINDARL